MVDRKDNILRTNCEISHGHYVTQKNPKRKSKGIYWELQWKQRGLSGDHFDSILSRGTQVSAPPGREYAGTTEHRSRIIQKIPSK